MLAIVAIAVSPDSRCRDGNVHMVILWGISTVNTMVVSMDIMNGFAWFRANISSTDNGWDSFGCFH